MNKFSIILSSSLIFTTIFFTACGGGGSSENTTTTIVSEDRAFTSTHFSGSQNCALCHNGIVDGNGADVSIESDWAATMMGNSSKDPLWKAKVASELKRNPDLNTTINDKCTKCHAPMANYEAHYLSDEIKVFENGFLNSSNAHYNEAMNGVSCALCHQIDATNLGTLDGFSGGYSINSNREIYGQFINPLVTPMQNSLNYTPVQSSHISESKMCATCHNLKTPFVDSNGDLVSTTAESEFPEQMPYSEWEHSDFSTTTICQECHMEKTDGVIISTRPDNGTLSPRNNFSRHNFVGGNKLMLDILNNNKTALGVVESANFTKTLTKTDELIQNAASITLTDNGITNNILSIDVNVSANTGHKLPTSFPSRRAFIHFTLYDVNDSVLFESGKVDANGSIFGANGDMDKTTYEPHYDVINSEDQVQIYEAIMQNSDNEVTYTLLRAASYVKDNRLLPRGFDKTTATSDIAVVGAANGGDANFIGGGDIVTYDINTSSFSTTPTRVEVELRYQTLSYPFAQDLFEDNTTQSNSFKTMFDASQLKTTILTTKSLDL
ncbi:multiheme c-type cytochrome [Sulfurimonas marina]|uniref:Cytochrome c-552/4 domain-containing protein n=1 Tax=Sulfurimonas marina TaxID=2590551 RepID=A0A7M3V9Q3_9BACT|nr:multiheme c-type cytochrome [Sulfurimonas marina]QOP40486.1 hypothetical protein FJR03_01515 [Sulfurimonas marina]